MRLATCSTKCNNNVLIGDATLLAVNQAYYGYGSPRKVEGLMGGAD
jgi:hypothetical protein